MLRDSCADCVVKHVGQAAVLIQESHKGYDYHFIYAMGHLAEAEDESIGEFPFIANIIREFRIKCLTGESQIGDIDSLVQKIYNWWWEMQNEETQ